MTRKLGAKRPWGGGARHRCLVDQLPADADGANATKTEEQLVTHFYARVSSRDQDPKPQVESAIARGISPANIHIEAASGARHERPVLTKLLAKLERGDVLVTFRLDRLGRSLLHLVKVLEDLEVRGVGFETLDGVSTQGSTGKLVLHILGSVAQFERQLLIERTMAGLKAARAEGRTGGHCRKMTPQDIVTARKHMIQGKLPPISRRCGPGVDAATAYCSGSLAFRSPSK